MNHLFREVKADLPAKYQYQSIEEHAAFAEDYILELTSRQALTKAGILSKYFWLKNHL